VEERLYYAIVAAIMIVLLPIVPKMVRVRIAVLRWLRWKWMADLHEKGFNPIVAVVRVVMACIAAYLFFLAIGG